MAAPAALRRLLHVLELEEEQAHRALQAATAAVRQLEQVQAAAGERERAGRALVSDSLRNNAVTDRLVGLEEMRLARGLEAAVRQRLPEAEKAVADRRQEYLAKRVERRQAETLIREAEAREQLENDRRGQQLLDDWYLGRRPRS